LSLAVKIQRTRNSPVVAVGELHRLNHATDVQEACQAVVCETMCLQAAVSCLLTEHALSYATMLYLEYFD